MYILSTAKYSEMICINYGHISMIVDINVVLFLRAIAINFNCSLSFCSVNSHSCRKSIYPVVLGSFIYGMWLYLRGLAAMYTCQKPGPGCSKLKIS